MNTAPVIASRTHPGLVRSANEDRVLAQDSWVFLADGMGGEAGGDVAAELCVRALASALSGDAAPSDEAFDAAFSAARRAVADRAAADPRLKGMGAALLALHLRGSALGLAHLGDVRAYVLHHDGARDDVPDASPRFSPPVRLASGATLRCLTRDHSSIAEIVERGHLSRDDGREHPLRSRLVRAVGYGESPPDVRRAKLRAGDRVMVCSDGLWEMVDDQVIAEILLSAQRPDGACEALVRTALAAGGEDNTTVVVLDVVPEDKP